MQPSDVVIEVLKGIREEIRETNVRLDDTNRRLDHATVSLGARIDETNHRLENVRDELSRRIVESEIRTSTAIADLAGTVREMTGVLRASHDLRPRVEQCEKDIAELRRTVGRP